MIEQNLLATQHQVTKNSRGFMHPISSIGEAFIAFAAEHSPVIDMGTAYGNIPLAALKAGAKKIIACDMEAEHLKNLLEQVDSNKLSSLETCQGYFPKDFNFAANSIAGVHASHVLEYLNPEEIEQGLQCFYDWLQPGGKLFILVYTVYIKEFINKNFQVQYANKKEQGVSWPGYMEDFRKYSSDPEVAATPFPKAAHLYDIPELQRALRGLGFTLEFCSYLNGRDNFAVEDSWHDGREYIGIIAKKAGV